MKPPTFVRTLTAAERQQLQAGLRAADAFTVRRCQILLASADGQRAPAIARNLHCAVGTVHYALRAFQREGLACLQEKSSRPHSAQAFLGERFTEALKDLLHHSPRSLGKPTSLWTLDLVAEVCHSRGWTPRVLSAESIRHAVRRLGVSWRRAKHWIRSPDPAYARKKKPGIA
jgi:transposase